jgi:hypothetical protein
MQINNKITRFLNGPYLFAGFIFLIPGLYALTQQQWLLAFFELFVAWFLFGTYSGVEIDTEKRTFREYNCWFGVIKTGQWKSIDNYLGLTLVSMNKVYKIYSRSNRVNSSANKEYRIHLVNKAKRPSVVLNKCKTHELAQRNMDELAIWLKLTVFSV